MKKTSLIMFGLMCGFTAVVAQGAESVDPGIYGQLDLKKMPKPELIKARPVLIDRSSKHASAQPVYVHVPPGHEWHWHTHCRDYNLCAMPVLFVTETWFVNVYLPSIGSQDGREQRYRAEATRERGNERDKHDRGEE